MIAILRKEINSFFSTLTGYLAIAVFLLASGLFLWILPSFSILDFGYATLDQLFIIGPYVLLFLAPAITMRTFSEEKRTGNIEILSTKPVSDWGIVLGKFLAGLTLVAFSLLPTLIYYYSVSALALPQGNVDHGAIIGSYIGLLFLGAAYLSLGLFSSAVTDNQVVSFLLGLFLCFLFYGLIELARESGALNSFDPLLRALSLQAHYDSVSRGVVDTRDLVYFASFTGLFLFATKSILTGRRW